MRHLALSILIFGVLLTGCSLSFARGPFPGEPQTERYTTVDDVRVRYLDEGQGVPVVLVHGFAASLDTWSGLVPRLTARGFRVIALDLKGFGWSDRPEGGPDDYSPQAQAQLLLGLLDQLGVSQFHLVAHSWGSSVALSTALAAPSRVQRIALYDAWVFFDQLPTFFLWARADGIGELLISLFYSERPAEKLASAFYDPSRLPEDKVEEVEDLLSRPGTSAAALEAIRGQRFEDLEQLYPRITQPTLLLWGREDTITLLRFGERLAATLPNARLIVFPQTGHFPMYEAAGSSTLALLDFLTAHSPNASSPEEATP